MLLLRCMYLFQLVLVFFFFPDKYPGMELLGSRGFTGGTSGKELACQCRRPKRCDFDPLVQEDPLEKGMATYSSILALRIP